MDMKQWCLLMEGQLITIPDVSELSDISNHEFFQALKAFRGESGVFNATSGNPLVAFYSAEEKEEFIKYLHSKGIKHSDLNTEEKEESQPRLLPQYKPKRKPRH